nr:S9 family peptidase [Bacteroidia bacterium]
GKRLAVSVTPTSSVDDSYMKQQVMVIDAGTGNVVSAIDNQGKLGQIVWSPDNKQLALKAAKDLNDPTDGSVLLVSAEGGKPAIIDAGFLGKYEHISWSDPNIIHFHASEGTASSLGFIRIDGSGKQTIFKSGDYAITGFARAVNGTIAFIASSASHPAELFTIANAKNATMSKRTNNNPWLSEFTLGKQEVIRYKARDGKYEIEGILMYPVNYVAGTKVPLIVVAHGGPESHFSNGWLTGYSTPGQMAATTGYAVFYPNYRGSTGRGNEFTYSSQEDLAGKEFDDIVDGVDYLIAQGVVDKSRVGVTGGSYGGYASAWMSTYYSERFAAAVMFVGISNNISKWGTSDIPGEMRLVHDRKELWEDWDGQLKRSPIYYVDRAQTPILIMHGANDPRVHPEQSMELFRHLKVRKPDLPVRLVYYPGEGHGNTKSGSRYDYNIRMMQWFDTYLKTGNPKAEKPSLDIKVTKK